jgi:HEPN domain-containing protein
MSKQTAVEWLGHEINKIYTEVPDQLFYDIALLLQQAKEMEKQQIIDAYENGENKSAELYYNETFKS